MGSDQAASVEPIGFSKICDSVKVINKALGDGVKVVMIVKNLSLKTKKNKIILLLFYISFINDRNLNMISVIILFIMKKKIFKNL